MEKIWNELLASWKSLLLSGPYGHSCNLNLKSSHLPKEMEQYTAQYTYVVLFWFPVSDGLQEARGKEQEDSIYCNVTRRQGNGISYQRRMNKIVRKHVQKVTR